MQRRKLELPEYAGKLLAALPGGILLTTKAAKLNSMVIGWGALGFDWSVPVFIAYVRESRFTREQLDQNPEFTLNIPQGQPDRRILSLCGSKSGRDLDKIRELGLTPVDAEKISVPAIGELPLTLECRIVARERQSPELIAPAFQDRFYPKAANGQPDAHILYTGEILSAYEIMA